MPTVTNVCHSCEKYMNTSDFNNISHFNAFKNRPNRRCQDCVFQAQLDKYQNPRENESYVIFLQMNRGSNICEYLLPFYKEMYEKGLVKSDVAPYIPLTKQFYTRDIESVADKIFQMMDSDLNLENYIDASEFMCNPELKQYEEGGYSITSTTFNESRLKSSLKRLSSNFPFITPLYELELILYKTKKETPPKYPFGNSFANWRSCSWSFIIWKTGENGNVISEVKI